MAGLSIGKFGYYMAIALSSKILLNGSNVIISQALHVDPVHITVMNVISTVIAFWFTLIRSNWVDNSHHKDGRFRPFMKIYGIPTLAFAAAIVWFPFSMLPNGGEAISADVWGTGYWMKVVILMVLFMGMQFFSPIYAMGYDNIIMVTSPNSQERLNIQTITTVVWGLAPTLYDMLFYSISDSFTNKLADINLYRYAYIPVCAVGLAISYVGYFSSKERITQSRAHYNQMTLRETFRAVAKNRNFWVLSAAGWAGFLENNANDLLSWTYVYQGKMTGPQYMIADMIVRESALISYVATPLAAKKFGKRTVLIACNLMNILLLGLTYNTYHIVPLLVLFRFVNFFLNCVCDNMYPALNADTRDAQQYISGERIDGMFDLVKYFGSLIGMGTGFVTPLIWRRGGVYEGNGAVDYEGNKSMWFALRDKKTFDNISRSMIVTSVIGAVMNVIPMFFYNLTESKQRGISKALKLRAMFEDYANGILKPELRQECAEFIAQARAGTGSEEENKYVLEELNKYEEPGMQRQLELAREIVGGGYKGILHFDPDRVKQARDKDEKNVLREMKEAQKNMQKFFPDGNPAEPDIRRLDTLYDMPSTSRQHAKEINAEIKQIEAERSIFHHSTKPYIKAKRLLNNCENAARLDEILAEHEQGLA